MALITSAASGNFNAGATWVGGIVPTVGDEARAVSGHIVTINVNTTCDEVSGATGGTMVLNSGVTLTANVTHKLLSSNGLSFLSFAANSPATATIIGNVTYAGAVNGSVGAATVFVSGTGTLNITGNCSFSALVGNSIVVNNNGSGVVNITGTCTGGSAFENRCVQNSGSGTINITGNVVGGVNTQNSVGVMGVGAGNITITGNCTGSGSSGAVNQGTGSLTIIGNCTGSSINAAAGAFQSSVGTMIVNGSIYATETASGVSGSNRGQVTRLTGPFYTSATFGVNPNTCLAWRWDTSLVNTTFIEVPTQNLASKRNLVTPDNATNFPSAVNVRSGTTYGISGALTGTCAVPPAASVATGVPVDNTTGTAALTPADFWNALTSGMTTSGSIGARLKNASTLDSTGQQLADALSP